MLTAVVAVREGSQRCKQKNIRPFGDTNLLEMKLKNLKKVRNLDKIVVNSESDRLLKVGIDNGVETFKRDPYYATSEVNNSEIHSHIADVTEADTIFLAPVCSPFISVETHENAIDYFMYDEMDSLTSVTEVKNHLWQDDKPLNYDVRNVPNSQDLPDIKLLNYGIAIIDRKVMKEVRGVVGHKPGFWKTSDLESIDIDTEFDWMVAESLYLRMKEDEHKF